jgi:hypothetical protein
MRRPGGRRGHRRQRQAGPVRRADAGRRS